jgi:hypothetical protein
MPYIKYKLIFLYKVNMIIIVKWKVFITGREVFITGRDVLTCY